MKFLIYILAGFILFSISTESLSQVITTGDQGILAEDCKAYPGLVNKIVKCVTRMTAYSVIDQRMNNLYDAIVGVSNAAVTIYIMLFGFKMAAGGVSHLRREVFFVLMTAVAVLTFNNTVGVTKFLNIFLRMQSEFASAATFAIATKGPQAISTPDDTSEPPRDDTPTVQYSELENAICYGPKDKDYKPENPGDPPYKPEMRDGKPVVYNVWQRVDCIIGYVIGAHPLVEKLSQYYDPNGTNQEVVAGYSVDNRKFDYDLFAGPENPFADMATDPFCFLKDVTVDAANDPDGCKDKKMLVKKTGTYEVGVSFSLFVIAIGMFFESAQSGGIGLIVLLTGVFIVFLMIAAFGQVMIVYISSMFAIVVLGLFAPLVVPCILFRPTKQIFQSWLQMLFGYTLQPGIMLAYLTFMIFVIQWMISYKKDMTVNMSQCLINDRICSPTAPPDNSQCINNPICTNQGEVCVEQRVENPGSSSGASSVSITDICKPCPAACAHASADMGFSSLAQMNFGGQYREGFKDLTSVIRTFRGTTSRVGGGENLAEYSQNTSGTLEKSGMDRYVSPSELGRGQEAYQSKSSETLAETFATTTNLASTSSNTDINITGGETSDASLPEFQFAIVECSSWSTRPDGTSYCAKQNTRYVNMQGKMAEYVRNQQNTDGINGIVNLDGEAWAKDFQNSGVGGIEGIMTSFNEQQLNMKANYMQVLLIVFLTLSITISFMHNVMSFSDQITGAGMRPISQMVDIYNMNVSRASKVIRS